LKATSYVACRGMPVRKEEGLHIQRIFK